MPSLTRTPKQTAAAPDILLIEEYDAIGVAICSALKRFAPNHNTVVAHSLAEAQKALNNITPDLLIIDFDPAYRGLTEFLEKMRGTHPDCKVLVIAPGVSPELAAERRSFGALQFVEKPFDVADFGAAVQALLGPWKEPESSHSRGTLRSLSLADIILLQCAGGSTVTIEARANNRKSGQIHMRKGQLCHAETGTLVGQDALEEMLTWSEVRMREADKAPSRKRTIKGPWQTAFLEASRQAQAQQPALLAPSKEVAPIKRQPKTGKKIVVIDDTEMLLIFVEDVLATAEPNLQITTALDGTSGVKAVERINPDLILLDYSLPDINGDEVCRRLLQDKETARIPILMMSGHVAEMSQTAATYENVVATIEKPFLSDALVALVQQTLKAGPAVTGKRPIGSAKKAERPSADRRLVSPAPPPAQSRAVEKAGAKPEVAPQPPEKAALPTSPIAASRPPREETEPAAAKLVTPSREATAQPIPTAPPLDVISPSVQVGKPASALPVESTQFPAYAPATAPAPAVGTPPHIAAPAGHEDKTTASRPPQSRTPTAPTISLPVVSAEPNDVVLGLFLEVVSMQLTDSLRMGAIRAKPSSQTVSLHVSSPALRAAFPENGFHLGPVEVDRNGRIATLRLIPTLHPFTPQQTRNALQISGVAVVPANAHERVELMPAGTAPMRMQLLAHLELSGVELSNTFQVAQLVLKSTTKNVRVTFSSQSLGPDGTGATCEAAGVKLDASARITELLLQPVGG